MEHRPPYVSRQGVYSIRDHECGHLSTAENAYLEVARDMWFSREIAGVYPRDMDSDAYIDLHEKVVNRLARWLAWVDSKQSRGVPRAPDTLREAAEAAVKAMIQAQGGAPGHGYFTWHVTNLRSALAAATPEQAEAIEEAMGSMCGVMGRTLREEPAFKPIAAATPTSNECEWCAWKLYKGECRNVDCEGEPEPPPHPSALMP